MAGITPDEAAPGYRHFFVRPQLVEGIDWVKASKDTPYGKLSVEWKREGDKLTLDVIVPVGTTATVVLPNHNEPIVLASGKHRI